MTPERDRARVPAHGWQAIWHEARGPWVRWRAGRVASLQRFAEAVEARGPALAREGDTSLIARLPDLRRRLAGGFDDEPLLAETFALVRETARRVLGTPHYAEQLMGGLVLARGMLAEMATGEGKTLTATLTACAAALAGIPVHVLSANDYLVERDAEAMGPLYRALGLSVGAATERDPDLVRRRAAYACDVTYGTAKAVAFDYLRDRLARGRARGDLALRIDRLSGSAGARDDLVLRGLCFAIVDEADSILIDEACTPLILSGAARSSGQRKLYRQALRLARALRPGIDYHVDVERRRVELTEAGRARLEEIAKPGDEIWSGPRRREEWVVRALAAEHAYLRDRDYVVIDGRVEIVDALTGRRAPDRSWEQGLHQLIELVEGCPLTPPRETLARITYPQFFGRYLRLAGMTGTAREVQRELWSTYDLACVRIPTRLPSRRRDFGVHVYPDTETRWRAMRQRIEELHRVGRPLLVGTSSIAASEQISRMLDAAGLPHRVLNARQDAEEAAIVAAAGQRGRITVATSMAGRGTDILLGPGVAEIGGLHVLATQRAAAARIDRQLAGRCARQGDPGSCERLLGADDVPVWAVRWLHFLQDARGRLPQPLSRWLTWIRQQSEEQRSSRLRKELSFAEKSRDDLLSFSGSGE
jgi:preprotein translocase subunit SecA